MRAFRRSWILLAGLALCVSLSGAASAQINPFRGFGPGMSDEDLKLFGEASDRLNTREHPVVGGVETWRNSQTGGGGTATLTRIYQWRGMPCHSINYDLLVANRTESRRRDYTLEWCRTADGAWKIRN